MTRVGEGLFRYAPEPLAHAGSNILRRSQVAPFCSATLVYFHSALDTWGIGDLGLQSFAIGFSQNTFCLDV